MTAPPPVVQHAQVDRFRFTAATLDPLVVDALRANRLPNPWPHIGGPAVFSRSTILYWPDRDEAEDVIMLMAFAHLPITVFDWFRRATRQANRGGSQPRVLCEAWSEFGAKLTAWAFEPVEVIPDTTGRETAHVRGLARLNAEGQFMRIEVTHRRDPMPELR